MRLYGWSVNAEQAVEELGKLRAQADEAAVRRDGPDHVSWKAKVDAVMRSALGEDSATLREYRDVRYSVGVWTGAPGEDQRDAQYFAARVGDAVGLIDAAIYELGLTEGSVGEIADPHVIDGPIFVVHGRDDARKYELVRLLERAIQRDAVVLHEQSNRGDTILEKLERHAQAASFAIVLLTGDDEGRLAGSAATPLTPRGRQNVILELGIFIGRIGRSRVVVLKEPNVEVPSDLSGLVYIALDPSGAWRQELLKELTAAGIGVDFDRVP